MSRWQGPHYHHNLSIGRYPTFLSSTHNHLGAIYDHDNSSSRHHHTAGRNHHLSSTPGHHDHYGRSRAPTHRPDDIRPGDDHDRPTERSGAPDSDLDARDRRCSRQSRIPTVGNNWPEHSRAGDPR